MKTLIKNKNNNLSLLKVIFLTFIPTTILTVSYILLGHVQNTIPSLLLFFLLVMFILLPMELAIILYASKKEFGSYSVKSAFVNQEKMSWRKILIYGFTLFGFAFIVLITVGSFENWIVSPLSTKLAEIVPSYFDWNNIENLRQYPKYMVLLTCIVYGILNVLIGPVIEELYFRGYLTSKISRYKKWSPVIITILFSLYHFWLPLQNIFRICAFLPAAYLAWKEKNIYISIVFHCLCNFISSVGFFVAVYS